MSLCNFYDDCGDGSDEDCEIKNTVLYLSMSIFLAITVLIWCWIRYKVSKQLSEKCVIKKENNDAKDYQSLKGDELVELKVNNSLLQFSRLYHC